MKSEIIGRAYATFGGQIQISIGWSEEERIGSIHLAQLKENIGLGNPIPQGSETYDTQVILAFQNIESLNLMRDAIDYLEEVFKNGWSKEAKGNWRQCKNTRDK